MQMINRMAFEELEKRIIEKYGSGIERVKEACRAGDLPEPEFGNLSGGFRIFFCSKKTGHPSSQPPST